MREYALRAARSISQLEGIDMTEDPKDRAKDFIRAEDTVLNLGDNFFTASWGMRKN